eukprot:TRINITY_DN36598_c0_g1_i1.p1 TRINITY_DN36598_c0_g1~~TRINITY_DN36598_c0_g1_i1.p1  ORF type:complete len:249 (+),score=46.86 TRINITY_DN36598_c0_g1_i1:45-791(+)
MPGKKKNNKANKKKSEPVAEAPVEEKVEKEQPAATETPENKQNNEVKKEEQWPPKELFEFVSVDDEVGKEYPVKGSDTKYVVYSQYTGSDEEMEGIMTMMTQLLSEPYPVFTYRYFMDNWPDLCWVIRLKDKKDPTVNKMIGAITCKASVRPKNHRIIRGYVAMLAILQEYRHNGFGSKLVMLAVNTMKRKGCAEVVLETEVTNQGALSLYEGLGFKREKRLDRYYQQGTDAFRLKLWARPPQFYHGA